MSDFLVLSRSALSIKEKEGVGRTHFRGYAEALREKEGLVGKRLADWFSRMAATAAEPHEGLKAVEDLVRGITRIPFDDKPLPFRIAARIARLASPLL